MINLNVTREESYPVHRISGSAAEHLYQFMKLFWKERLGQKLQGAEIEGLLAGYRASYLKPALKPLRDVILELAKRRRDDKFSILELGCANASMLHFLKDAGVDTGTVDFHGIDMWEEYVLDAGRHFPDAVITQGDVETFIEMPESAFSLPRYDVFVASLTLCMIEPGRAERALAKAASMAKAIVLQETFLNLTGNIATDGAVIFPFNAEMLQFYFANPYKLFLDKLGFQIGAFWEIPFADGKRSWSVFCAMRPE